MQKYFYSEKSRKRLDRHFGGQRSIVGKGKHNFPSSAEREYIRAVNSYMRSVKKLLEEEMPELKKEYRRQLNDNVRTDSIFGLDNYVSQFLQKILDKLNAGSAAQKLITQLFKIGKITKHTEITEWKKMVKKTLGVNLSEDYYNGRFFETELEQWVSDNVDLITMVPANMLDKMKETIVEGYSKGLTAKDIGAIIQQNYNMSANHARFIARDQMAKLSADITRKEHEDAGVSRYQWSDSGDQRVRPGHALLNDKVFCYDNPPEIMEWRDTKSGGYWVNTGRRCNPGQDFNCRCVAIPVFDYDDINLPLEDDKE